MRACVCVCVCVCVIDAQCAAGAAAAAADDTEMLDACTQSSDWCGLVDATSARSSLSTELGQTDPACVTYSSSSHWLADTHWQWYTADLADSCLCVCVWSADC